MAIRGNFRTFRPAFAMATAAAMAAAAPVVQRVDDFGTDDLSRWQTSMSPQYYKGGTGRKGLEVVDDPVQGRVLRCNVRFSDPRKSEPVFITRRLDPSPRKMDVVGIRFRAFLTAPAIDPNGGFKVRLRTSPRAFSDYDVQAQLGRPFPVGKWVSVSLDASIGPNVRNVWGKMFGKIGQMTFRLDDIDGRNAEFALLLDEIELVLRQPAESKTYTPRASVRPRHRQPRVLFLKNRAAGYYGLRAALAAVAPGARVDTFPYRGYHFEFFGFPESREAVLAYDLIIMLDVDPIMMTPVQCRRIADAVASGAHLLVFGGPVTLTHAKDFKAALQAVLPVTFRPGAKDLAVRAPPAQGPEHFLNRGLDPDGLGTVTAVQAVNPRPGAAIPWSAGGQPLIVTRPVQQGRATLVNTWPHVKKSAVGDFFTSTLSDDLVRRLVRFCLGRTRGPDIAELQLPPLEVVGGGSVRVRFSSSAGGPDNLRLYLDDRRCAGPVADSATGAAEFRAILPAPKRSAEIHRFVASVVDEQGRETDRRDFTVTVLHPVKLEVAWTRSKNTFAPGGPVEFEVSAAPRGLPRIEPGERVRIGSPDGAITVAVDGFVDAWVYKPGTDTLIHNQAGSASVAVRREGDAFLPQWTVTGQPRAARKDSDLRFGPDDRVLDCRRTIRVLPSGAVEVNTDYTVRQHMKVHRLPLTVSLPADVFAGLSYTAKQSEGVRRGTFPNKAKKERFFDGHGLSMTVRTPQGPLRVEVPDGRLRVWLRDLRQYRIPAFRLEIEAPYADATVEKGATYRIPVRVTVPGAAGVLPPVSISADKGEAPRFVAAIQDVATGFEWNVPKVESRGGTARFAGVLPNLATGAYMLTARLTGPGGDIVKTETSCAVVDPPVWDDFYPIMSIIGIRGDGHYLDETGIAARIDDLIAHGFNTAAITGIGSFRNGRPDNAARLTAVSERLAQSRGMATVYEYTNFLAMRRKGPTSPCILSPAFPRAAAERLDWQVDVCLRTPRLLSLKVTDEPHYGPGNLDRCEYCRRFFRERYGLDLPEGPAAGITDPYTRWALADFIGAYFGRGFATSAAVAARARGRFDLLLTYMASGLGYQRPLRDQQDALDWSRSVQRVDFDVYPYFYPHSQRIRMVQAAFCMAFMRDVASARQIPWGFYMELDDRNWPFQKNPKEATAECAFTAVAYGADYLNSFIHRVVGTGTQARPERWAAAGKALRLIRKLGPVLRRMPAVRAPLAVIYPNSQEAIGDNGWPRPDYLFAALRGGFGDVDIANEQLLTESGGIPYRALVLLKTTFVHADFVPLLRQWLRGGGLLVCDRLPQKTHRGRDIAWGFPPLPAPERAAGGPLRIAGPVRVGRGRILVLGGDPDADFKNLVEAPRPDPAAVRAFRTALGDLLRPLAEPGVHVEYAETPQSVDLIEAGLRGNRDAVLLAVVNHQPAPRDVRATLRGRSELSWFVDAATGQEVPWTREADGSVALELSVSGRWARFVLGYRTRPARLVPAAAPQVVERGGRVELAVEVRGGAGRPV
ncbi:MAG: hypothetical protein GXP31_12030, partial [Kiritimatiellaeota bacterium]|nr:hypothetical protein [Kiritimatiellota bacterium]